MFLLSLCWYCIFQALVLLIAANGAPVVASKAFGNRLLRPIDFGLIPSDGHRLFGCSKTWRGLFSAILVATATAVLFELEPLTGLLFGTLTIAGDLLTSFIKRRLGYVESSRARGLDTTPETLLPLWILKEQLSLNYIEIALVVGLFFLCEEFFSPILYRLHIRDQPY